MLGRALQRRGEDGGPSRNCFVLPGDERHVSAKVRSRFHVVEASMNREKVQQ